MKKNIIRFLILLASLNNNFVYSQSQNMRFLVYSKLALSGVPLDPSNKKVTETSTINLSVKNYLDQNVSNYGHTVINLLSPTKRIALFQTTSDQFGPFMTGLKLNFSGGYSNISGGGCTTGDPVNGVSIITFRQYTYTTNPVNGLFNFSNGEFDDSLCTSGNVNIMPLTLTNQVLTKGICEEIKLPNFSQYNIDDLNPDNLIYTIDNSFFSFKWQYKIGNSSSWNDLPQSYNFPVGDEYYTFKPQDIIGNTTYQGNLSFRFIVETSSSVTPQTTFTSDVIVFEIKPCAPHIVSQSVQNNNNCFDGSHGIVQLGFDKAPEASLNQYIVANLQKEQSDGTFVTIDSFQILPSQLIFDSSTNWYNYQLSNLYNGTYKLTYQLAYNLPDGTPMLTSTETSTPFTINSPPKITFSKVPTNILCNGAATGSITVTATGGVPPYSYSKDNGATWQTNSVLSNLPAGSYQVLVKDNNGCIAPDGNQTVTITEPASAIAIQLVSKINPSTNISNDGSIDVNVTGGTGAYTYYWTSTLNNIFSQNTNEDLTGLSGDATYTLTVTDANGCTATRTEIIDAPEPIVITFNNPQLLCNGDVVNLTATITGGNLPYDYPNFIWVPSGFTPVNTANTSTLNGVGQGTYTITIKDARNVFKSATYTIGASPSAISIQGVNTTIIGGVSSIEQKCFGDNSTNFIDANVSGGTAPYSYSWYNLANSSVIIGSTQDLSNVAPGSYKLEVKDANNCVVSKNFNIIPVSQINFTATISGAIVNPGTATGSITVNANGGSGSYVYSLNGTNWQFNNTFNNLVAGTYNFYVKDSNNCIVGPQSITLIEPSPFTIAITLLNPISCFGGNDGSLQVTATGGTPFATGSPYIYSWSDTNGNNYSANTITNLSTGFYTVTVTDSNGVTRTISNYSLIQPSQLTGSRAKTDSSCYLSNNGSIIFTASGGTAPYNYFVNGILYTSNIVSNLTPGTYTCEIRDSKNCLIVLPNVSISEPTILNVSGSIYPVTNGTTTDGSITVTVTGGTPPYTYTWPSNPTNTTNVLSNIGTGTYNVTVTDANGCSVTQSYTVTTIQALAVSLNAINSINTINCYGDTNGKLEAIASGGRPGLTTPNYLYEWRNTLNQVIGTSASINNLVAGIYTVYVTDFNTPPSTIQQSFTITQPASPLTASVQIANPILCAGGTGSLSVAVNGGTPTYTYEWKNSANTVVGTTSIVNSLVAGNYTCKVTDANGCSNTQTITLTSPNALNATYSQVNVLISGQSTGSITVNATGGTGAYTYILNNSTTQTTNVFANLAAGNYIVDVKDANSCTVTLNVTITESSVLQVVINQPVANQILCYGGNTGALTTTVSGGVAPYYYQWKKNGEIMTGVITSSINNLTVGLYEVEVKDNVGAIQTQTFTITEPTQLAVSFVTNPVTCTATNSGSITATVTGGTPPYTFSWNTGYTGTNNLSSDTYHILENIPIGAYNVTITDSNGCPLTPPSVTVGTSTGLNLGATVVDVTCGNVNNGSISINPTGGTGNYTINWTNSAYSGFILTNLAAGTYTGTLIDGTCTLPFSLNIQGTTPLTVNLGTDVILCAGQTHSIDATIAGQTLTYGWTATNGFTSTSPIVTLTDGGIYTLTVTTSNGCIYTDSVLITKLGDAIESKCMVASQTFKDQEIVLINISDKQSNNSYQWIVPPQAEIISQNDDVLILKFTQIGTYDVGLKSTNSSGCQIIDSKSILVEEGTGDNTIDTSNIFIKEFTIFPNPVPTGVSDFNVLVTLAYEMPITISIYKIEQGVLINETSLSPAKVHNKQFNLNLVSGVYFVVLKTSGSVQAKKIIKN